MIQRLPHGRVIDRKGACLSAVRGRTLSWILFLFGLAVVPCKSQSSPLAGGSDSTTLLPRPLLTNTIQFKALPANNFLEECPFRLQGVVTLVDTNRNLVVLQDVSGALALHFDLHGSSIQVGQIVLLEGTNCFPYVAGFPDYPYQVSARDVRKSFEAPTDWGNYYLTRMRGSLHPMITGEYTFWIASDNSSELWLSTDEHPQNVRKIASLPSYSWVNPHDWTRYPSQRSETILLKAGQAYYIEAFQEQTTGGDNLSIAWQGPGLNRSVIDGRYLAPPEKYDGKVNAPETNGVLREYWTNYSAGDLSILTAPRPFEFALSVENAKTSVLGQGWFPEANNIVLDQPLPVDDNFHWGVMDGIVKFVGLNGDAAVLELSAGQASVQARVAHLNPKFARRLLNASVRIEGVCEGGHDQDGKLVPGIIWSPSENYVSLAESTGTNPAAMVAAQSLKPRPANGDSAMQGFFVTLGVVTFNDRVFDNDCLFVQRDAGAMFVSLKDRHFKNSLEVGQGVELGGGLRPGKFVPVISPLVVTATGWRSMPEPLPQPVELPIPGSRDGRWSELEGVVRSVNSNGTLSIAGRGGNVCLWVGKTPLSVLRGYVDAKLRVRGVLSLTTLDSPLLLIPSRNFVDVEENAPEDPFKIPTASMADLLPDNVEPALVHRAKVQGEIIYQDGHSLFMQDASGGLRVPIIGDPGLKTGEIVEVVGFPDHTGPNRVLTGALFRFVGNTRHIKPRMLDLTETLASKQRNTLVQVTATLLSQKVIGRGQLLELQEEQRVFTATVLDDQKNLPFVAPGSRVWVTGICDEGTMVLPGRGKAALEKAADGSLNILLRGPSDLTLLSGPPWWTLKRTATLVGSLLIILVVTLLWVYLLRRRLERQQAARLLFSRQMLQGQENERQRIAVNLHDSLGQNLLVIKNQACLAMQPATDEAIRQDRLSKISEMTSQAIEEVRQITHGLRPYQLDRLGLTQAIRAIVNQISENSTVLIASSSDNIDGIFDKESEIHVYRIVQEALNNILKHSAATEAAVVVKSQDHVVSLSIRDNGRGFDPAPGNTVLARDSGHGLSGIRERVRILGGILTIDSGPDQGTNIGVEIMKPAKPVPSHET